MHRYKVTMSDGYSEVVTAKSEELARVQCLHLKIIHGDVLEAKKARVVKKENPAPTRRAVSDSHAKGLVEAESVSSSKSTSISYSELSDLTEEEVEDKVTSLVMSFGRDKALLLCIEMLDEYFRFKNPSRTAFWTSVMREVGNFSK